MTEQQVTDAVTAALAALSKPIDTKLAGPAVLVALDTDPAATHGSGRIFIRFPAANTCRVVYDQHDVTVVA